MARRNVSRYELGDRGKLVYVGTTEDPWRRAQEHHAEGKRFTSMNVVGPKVTPQTAENWEQERLDAYQRSHRGRLPRYNETETG